jgi:hypothetical protein
MTELATNVLYYGDNLDILRRYLTNTVRHMAAYRTRSAPEPVAIDWVALG